MAAVKRLLMCAPRFYRVAYSINPWMKPDVAPPVKPHVAQSQWEALRLVLVSCGAAVSVMEPAAGAHDLPDIVFCANAAVVRRRRAFLSHFATAERQPERRHNELWFKQHGFDMCGSTELPFEGAGDALFAGDGKLFAGFGFRSAASVYANVQRELTSPDGDDGFRMIKCHLVDQRFYHLDTCFCPLDAETALWFPGAFDEASRKLMKAEMDLIEVDEADAMRFACNAVAIGRHVVLPSGNMRTATVLEKRAFSTHFVDMSEFLKSGGAAKCLTLEI